MQGRGGQIAVSSRLAWAMQGDPASEREGERENTSVNVYLTQSSRKWTEFIGAILSSICSSHYP